MNLKPVTPDLLVHAVPYRASGLWLGRQIVVVRLSSETLWVHSPIPVTQELRRELAALGRITHVVGPNRMHDECLTEFQAEYPDALMHAAPGLAEDRPDLRFAPEPLGDRVPNDWSHVLDAHLVRGMPRLNEVVFFHRPSRSLILADLAFNLGPEGPWTTRLLLQLNGAWGHFGPSRLCRSWMKDRAGVRASIEHILAWDFDRIVVGHGRNVEQGGRAVFEAAFAFLSR